jgi:hypothetical protein
MITGYERVSTTEQNLGSWHDGLKPAPMLRSIRPKRAIARIFDEAIGSRPPSLTVM